jgi:hypothetical protein
MGIDGGSELKPDIASVYVDDCRSPHSNAKIIPHDSDPRNLHPKHGRNVRRDADPVTFLVLKFLFAQRPRGTSRGRQKERHHRLPGEYFGLKP